MIMGSSLITNHPTKFGEDPMRNGRVIENVFWTFNQQQLFNLNPPETIKSEINILGILFNTANIVSTQNWVNIKNTIIKKSLSIHWKRDLSIYGRVAIINTLALCHINHIHTNSLIQIPSSKSKRKFFNFCGTQEKLNRRREVKFQKENKLVALEFPI